MEKRRLLHTALRKRGQEAQYGRENITFKEMGETLNLEYGEYLIVKIKKLPKISLSPQQAARYQTLI